MRAARLRLGSLIRLRNDFACGTDSPVARLRLGSLIRLRPLFRRRRGCACGTDFATCPFSARHVVGAERIFYENQ